MDGWMDRLPGRWVGGCSRCSISHSLDSTPWFLLLIPSGIHVFMYTLSLTIRSFICAAGALASIVHYQIPCSRPVSAYTLYVFNFFLRTKISHGHENRDICKAHVTLLIGSRITSLILLEFSFNWTSPRFVGTLGTSPGTIVRAFVPPAGRSHNTQKF